MTIVMENRVAGERADECREVDRVDREGCREGDKPKIARYDTS